MGNRPINRRPWRRPPRIKRKVQWVDGLSAGTFDRDSEDPGPPFTTPCIIPQLDIQCDPFDDGPRSTLRTVWAGPTDATHLDQSNALIERIVGSLELRVYSENVSNTLVPLVRLGLLAVEEVPPGDASELQRISLWDNTHIQDYEWMWLYQTGGESQASPVVDAVYTRERIPIDVRVRRSLGKQDGVLLLASFVTPLASDIEPPTAIVHLYPMLRVLHSTR